MDPSKLGLQVRLNTAAVLRFEPGETHSQNSMPALPPIIFSCPPSSKTAPVPPLAKLFSPPPISNAFPLFWAQMAIPYHHSRPMQMPPPPPGSPL